MPDCECVCVCVCFSVCFTFAENDNSLELINQVDIRFQRPILPFTGSGFFPKCEFCVNALALSRTELNRRPNICGNCCAEFFFSLIRLACTWGGRLLTDQSEKNSDKQITRKVIHIWSSPRHMTTESQPIKQKRYDNEIALYMREWVCIFTYV